MGAAPCPVRLILAGDYSTNYNDDEKFHNDGIEEEFPQKRSKSLVTLGIRLKALLTNAPAMAESREK